MKALTIYQPWASLIMAGAKPFEFRGWSPRQRGGAYARLIGERIVIHASAKPIDRKMVEAFVNADRDAPIWRESALKWEDAMEVFKRAMHTHCATERGLIDISKHGDLPWGVGLGTAILGEPRNGLDIAAEFGLPRVNDSDRDAHANFGWPLTEIEVWPDPVECRGLQGFWKWPEPADLGL